MIQRKQTLFLAIAFILNAVVVFTPIADRLLADPAHWIRWFYLGTVGVNALLIGAAIALFKNRTLQAQIVRLSAYLFVVILATETAVLLTLGGIGTYLWDEALSTLLTAIGLVLNFVARSAIMADEALIKSMDRLR